MRAALCATIACLLFAASCKKDRPSDPVVNVPSGDSLVLVACEGSYGNGNAALSVFSRRSGLTTEDVFYTANTQHIGDVLQSITPIGDELWLCVNNSDKLLVVDAKSFQLKATVQVPKPRYILQVSATRAYVSSIFSNRLFVINPQTRQVSDTLFLPYQNPEGMLLRGNDAYLCCWDTACAELLCLDAAADTLQPQKAVGLAGRAPQDLVMDMDGAAWVLSGNVPKGKPGALTRFRLGDGQVLAGFSLTTASDLMRPVMNPTADTLYWLLVNYSGGSGDNGVYRMDIHSTTLPASPFVAAQSLQYFWGLDIAPDGAIYIGDPKGFTQKGSVLVYHPDGTSAGSFATGVGPGHFYFR